MFKSPATPAQVTASLAPGSTVVTAAGSVVDRATTDTASIANAAIVQGVLPPGVPYASASIRASACGAVNAACAASPGTVTIPVLTQNLGFRYMLRNFLLSANQVGLHAHFLYRTTPAGAQGAQLFAAFADTGKNPLLFTFNYFALAFNEGLQYVFNNAATVVTTAACSINYDVLNA